MDIDYEYCDLSTTQIGMVVLQSDETLESDLRRILPAQAELLVSRVASAPTVSADSLRAMAPLLTQSAALLPRAAKLAAVGYGCTSATAQIGAAQIAALVKDGVTTQAVTEPVSALLAACAHLNIQRLAVITPYVASVSERLHQVLRENGIEITACASFNEAVEANVVRISANSVQAPAIQMGQHPDCDAVFLSCTNLRTLDVIGPVEAAIGKPVLSSNQVLGWHLMQLAGLDQPTFGPGRLFDATRLASPLLSTLSLP